MGRTVTLTFDDEFQNVVIETIGQVYHTIGYLAMWAISSEQRSGNLTIFGDREGNLHARYRNKAGEVTYEIFGMRDENGEYSTHS